MSVSVINRHFPTIFDNQTVLRSIGEAQKYYDLNLILNSYHLELQRKA